MKRNFTYFIMSLLSFILSINVSAQEYKRLTNLPALYIFTENGAPITSKENYIKGSIYFVDENDEVTFYDDLNIRGRGNSTWNLRKKPYRLKFESKKEFLGEDYAKAKSWTLLANAADKTLMRNAVTSLVGEFLGLPFNPATKFVDVTLNGEYLGNYQISDQVEVRGKRVDVTEQDYPLPDGADITGGYLLEVDGWEDGNCFVTSQVAVPIRIHYPDEDEIVDRQNRYIIDYINNFERILMGENFDDPENGYRALVDSATLAAWYIATEVSANIDGFYSTYFYKEQGDPLLYWGPLWDYDIAYANDVRKGDTTNELMSDIGYGQARIWINRMWEDPWFSKLITRRWNEICDNGFEDFLMARIDSINDLIQESQELNYKKWGIDVRMYNERVLYSSYSQYVTDLKNFIHNHNAFLGNAFANKQPAEETPEFVPDSFYYRITNASTAKAVDIVNCDTVAGTEVCTWTNNPEHTTQNWEIRQVGNYFLIINRHGNVALNDPTQGYSTETTNTGTHLNVAAVNPDDDRQLWTIKPQGTSGYYNIINKRSKHTANLEGGNSADGTALLSWTTDGKNSTSTNRLWYIIPDEELPDEPGEDVGIGAVEPDEYALAYNPQTQILHFGSASPEQLTFTARIYTSDGRIVGQFRADEEFNAGNLPDGVYIVSWTCGSKNRSAKFMK